MGIMTWDNFAARRWERRLSAALTSKRWKLTRSRIISWTVRTPLMFSASAPLTMELVWRARMKAFFANGSQNMRTTNSAKTTDRVKSPNFALSDTSTVTIPSSKMMSPIAVTVVSRNSCNAPTSLWRRAMRRPTSVLSMNDMDKRCRCTYMARRKSNRMRSAVLPTMVSWIYMATRLRAITPRKARAMRSS